MYKLIYIFLFTLSACITDNISSAETANNQAPLPTTTENLALNSEALKSVIKLNIQEVTHYQNLAFKLVDIEDSRCATGENCIWAGQIIVSLEVSNQNDEKLKVKLIRKRESNLVTAFGYSLRLLDVSPYPKKDKLIELSEQIVKLEIMKNDG